MSGFKYLPNQDEIGKYDPRYIEDMKLAMHIYNHQHNQEYAMNLFEQWEAFNKDPDGFKTEKEAVANESFKQIFQSHQVRQHKKSPQ